MIAKFIEKKLTDSVDIVCHPMGEFVTVLFTNMMRILSAAYVARLLHIHTNSIQSISFIRINVFTEFK